MKPEFFKKIVDYPDYEISNYGTVRSWKSGEPRRLKAGKGKSGYFSVVLMKNSKRINELVHRLVLKGFKGEPPKGMEGCHNDGDRANNYSTNLRWDTRKNNHADKHKHGTAQQGERIGNSKLKNHQVLEIREARKKGVRVIDLAEIYGVKHQTISRIANRIIWKHI